MIRLGVNLDHIATIREARKENYPDPVQAALLAELAGADNITCHLREDRRHIQDKDVFLLKELSKIPLNFEIAATSEMLEIACQIKPTAVTLVPEKRQELTTESGLVFSEKNFPFLQASIKKLKESGSLVVLFIEATKESVSLAKELGAQAIEIHTGPFCLAMNKAKDLNSRLALVRELQEISHFAHSLKLHVHCGHGLNYENASYLQLIPELQEANIGHSIIARSLYVGLVQAIKDMKELLNNPNLCPKNI